MLLLGCCGCCFTINKECSTHTTLAVLALLGLLRLDARYARAPRPAPTRSRAVVSSCIKALLESLYIDFPVVTLLAVISPDPSCNDMMSRLEAVGGRPGRRPTRTIVLTVLPRMRVPSVSFSCGKLMRFISRLGRMHKPLLAVPSIGAMLAAPLPLGGMLNIPVSLRCVACICGQTLQEFQPVLLPLKQLAYLPNSYSKLCDEETACGQCLASWRHPSWLCDGAAVAGGGLLRPPGVSPVRVTRSS